MEMLNIWNKSKYQFQKIGFVAFALWKSLDAIVLMQSILLIAFWEYLYFNKDA